jgi:Kef-type K+ transport system membrane component KefB
VNAGTGLSALWVLLTCVAYALFLVYAIRPAFLWILNRSRSLQEGPSQAIVALTLLLVLASAFFTGVIGVHPIFGAFMIGIICPHDAGFAIKLTEKVEDLISALFLPLYFALSGLSTNLGLLNTGMVWAYVIGIISVAFFGKLLGATFAARICGLVWRESFAIGTLMSCKGLVELIVLVREPSPDIQRGSAKYGVEYRPTSEDPNYPDIYHVRCHGLDNNFPYHTLDDCAIPAHLSEKN